MTIQIDLNTADETTLAGLKGIGPALAERIVQYRQENGEFSEPSALTGVKGITQKMVDKLADEIAVSEPITAEPLFDSESSAAEPDAVAEPEEIEAVEEMEETISILTSADDDRVELEENEETISTEHIDYDPPPVPPMPPVPEVEIAQRVPAANVAAPTKVANSLRDVFLVAIAAFAGAILALVLLSVLNGTLRFAQRQAVSVDQQDAQTALDNLQAEQAQAAGELMQVQSALATIAADESISQQAVATIQADTNQISNGIGEIDARLATAEAATNRVDNDLATMAASIEGVATRIDSVATTTDRFDNFLQGLRDLLSLDSNDDGAEAQLTPSPTQAAATATPSPTRTPRPSATPIVVPTATP